MISNNDATLNDCYKVVCMNNYCNFIKLNVFLKLQECFFILKKIIIFKIK